MSLQAVVGAAIVVGGIVGVLKYTGRDKDVEQHSKGVKGKLEKKGKLLSPYSVTEIILQSFNAQI